METVRWKIEGLRCGACARTIEARLAREPGVRQAEVAYPRGTVRILLDPDVAVLDPLIGLLEQAGYRIDVQLGDLPAFHHAESSASTQENSTCPITNPRPASKRATSAPFPATSA